MNRTINRPRTTQMRCARPSMPPLVPIQLTEFNRELQELPLAMAYVPMQCLKNAYCLEEALMAGTLFPELDKPFTGVKGGCPCGK